MLKESDLSENSTTWTNERNGLKARFVALWARCADNGKPGVAEAIYRDLTHLYGEAHRHYHTLDHIQHCLQEFDQAAAFMEDPNAVEIALWFHDAIYEPGAKNNELRSAEWFRECANSIGCTDVLFQQRIHDLIMITAHRELPRQHDEQFIVDIDLSSFGLPWDEFEQDGSRIRAECAHMMDDDFYPGQLRFLRTLRKRPTFFSTDFFQRLYEQRAQENIKRLITNLHRRGYDGNPPFRPRGSGR